MTKYPLIRTIYLYLFSLVGLVLLIIGSARFVDMGLKAYVFTRAEDEERIIYKQPPYPSIRLEKIAEAEGDVITSKDGEIILSESEKVSIERWIADYNSWEENRSKIDPVTSRRHRNSATNLSLILIGLPLYLYHWMVIRKESKKRKEN